MTIRSWRRASHNPWVSGTAQKPTRDGMHCNDGMLPLVAPPMASAAPAGWPSQDNSLVSRWHCCARSSLLTPTRQARHERRQHVLLLAAAAARTGAITLQIHVNALHMHKAALQGD